MIQDGDNACAEKRASLDRQRWRSAETLGHRAVLLALEEHGRPTKTLERVSDLARALGAPLHVLRVLREHPIKRLLSRVHLGSTLSAVHRSIAATRATRAWCDDALGRQNAGASVHIRIGAFIEEAADFAVECGARLIVLPPREGRAGTSVAMLAGACAEPVLVMRRPERFKTLVAATDLEDDDFPVLRSAIELGSRLEGRVVAVHNVDPTWGLLPMDGVFAATVLFSADTVRLREQRLQGAAEHLPGQVETMVLNQPDTVEVILGQSDAIGASLIVVGTRARPWFDRMIVKSVAAEVVNRAPLSVLVTPLGLPLGVESPEPA